MLTGTRIKAEGITSIYDMMWACNISMFTTAIGLYRANAEIIGAGIAMVSIDQTLWWLDILSYAIFRKFKVGVARYLEWEDTSFTRVLTSTHHLWFIPL